MRKSPEIDPSCVQNIKNLSIFIYTTAAAVQPLGLHLYSRSIPLHQKHWKSSSGVARDRAIGQLPKGMFAYFRDEILIDYPLF
jgi:hypothetical protein